jgi:hypothetical protein
MPRLVAANNKFAVYAPSLISWGAVSSFLRLKPSTGLNWWVRHLPTGTEFRLTTEEQRVLDDLGDRLGKLLGGSGADAAHVLLSQIEVFWKERQRKQQVHY